MSIGNLICNLQMKTKKTIRTIENINNKLLKAKSVIKFNGQCLKDNIRILMVTLSGALK